MSKVRKTPFLSIKEQRKPKAVFNRTNYRLILQLYYIIKTQSREEPRLPRNDFRRQVPKNKIFQLKNKNSVPLKKKLLRIAALW